VLRGAAVTAVLFTGPTLAGAAPAALEGFVLQPPAAQGDVYRAARRGPRVIALVDGYFHGVPSVWHKEILWAMAAGIHVFGAASMGALRAAELHSYGMRGVGRIFAAYRDGTLIDDDEVAVAHGPAELGFPPVSEPMVNVRATLDRAVAEGVLDNAAAARLAAVAKAQYYAERTWDTILAAATELPADRITALRDWLPTGAVDQKRADALELVAAVADVLRTDLAPLNVDYRFEHTEMWAGAPWLAEGPESDDLQPVLDELRLLGPRYRELAERALLRAGAVEPDSVPGDRAAREAKARFMGDRGLLSRADLEAWMQANDADTAATEALLEDQAAVDEALRAHAAGLGPRLVNQLRLDGDYARLAARARDKAAALGADAPRTAAPVGRLLEWHFGERLGRPVPRDVEAHARALGLAGTDDFVRLLRRELAYTQGKTRES